MLFDFYLFIFDCYLEWFWVLFVMFSFAVCDTALLYMMWMFWVTVLLIVYDCSTSLSYWRLYLFVVL